MESIKEQLLIQSSKSDSVRLCNRVLAETSQMRELVQVFLEGPNRLTQRAAGIICLCVEKNPDLILPYLSLMLEKMKEVGVHDAIKRNTLRILQFVPIPEELEGELMDLCFGYLDSRKEAVAIKVFSMTVLFRLSEKYPEIRGELRILIEDQIPYEKAAFLSRGKKILKKLEKE